MEGYAEITATADFISRYFLILVYDPDHDNYIRGGCLDVYEIPIILAHHCTAKNEGEATCSVH